MINEITAKRLLQAMTDANLTQKELSDKSGVSESSVSQYINGTHAPSNVSAGKLAEALNVSPVWLMGFDTNAVKRRHIFTEEVRQAMEEHEKRIAMKEAVKEQVEKESSKSGYDYTVFPRVSNSPEEGYLVDKYREMPEEKRKKLLAYMMGLCKGADLDET